MDNQILWKDKNDFLLILIPSLIIIPFFSFLLIYDIHRGISIFDLVYFGMVLFFLFGGYKSYAFKKSYITKEGFYVGDILKQLNKNPNNRVFLKWKSIKSVKLIERQMQAGHFVNLIYLLFVTDKKGVKYEGMVYHPKGLKAVFKQLNRLNLLTLNFKYSNLRDSDLSEEEIEDRLDKIEAKEKIL